ncbi:MAG: class I SAM-dependent methyltransferase [Candidatus Omnitrophica bacterium]|nr:class I SAM-dependent methyltransferase [Candidatus Omnitrophota bacterium]
MGILNKVLSNRSISRKIVLFLLRVHHKIYTMLGRYAAFSEGGLHPKHRLMDYHKFFVDNIKEGDRVLDVGCGNGALSFDLAMKAAFVTAIDINREHIEHCLKKYKKENIKYILDDIGNMPQSSRFDAAILSSVLEHIEDRAGLLQKLSKITEKIIVRVPMIDRDWVTLYRKELGLPYLLDPTHKIEYTLDIFKDELKRGCFRLEEYFIRFGEIWAVCLRDF